MGSRKNVRGEMCNVPMKEKKIEIFYAVEKEAYSNEENWNN